MVLYGNFEFAGFETTNEFFGTNLSKTINNDDDYVVNHYNLTSKLGLFKYNPSLKTIPIIAFSDHIVLSRRLL